MDCTKKGPTGPFLFQNDAPLHQKKRKKILGGHRRKVQVDAMRPGREWKSGDQSPAWSDPSDGV